MKLIFKSPWKDWWQSDIPCHFNPEQAAENCKYLINILDEKWLTRCVTNPGSRKNPLIQKWIVAGANSFIELNALAEDLRILEHVLGLSGVIENLKNPLFCLPTWHTIHSAAILERGERGIVKKFLPETEDTSPDFLLKRNIYEIPVEAKLLTISETQLKFEQFARGLEKSIKSKLMIEEKIYPTLAIVCKSYDNLPDVSELTKFIEKGIQQFKKSPIHFSHESFNVFLDFPRQDVSSFSAVKDIGIFCPKSEKENSRITNRIKDASKQLKSYKTSLRGGVLFLGLTEFQDPHSIKTLIENGFKIGRYSGISRAIFNISRVNFSDVERGMFDLLGSVTNNNKPFLDITNLKLHPIGRHGSIFDFVNAIAGIPAYRFASVEAKVKSIDGTIGLYLPDIKTLTPALIR